MKKSLNDESSSFNVADLGLHAHIKNLEGQIDLLTKQNVGYSQTVDSLLSKIEQKDNTIMHLEKLLKGVTPVIGEISPFLVSDEEYLITMVIKNLKENSIGRTLTKDEMGILDLAIKNKRLLQGQATNINEKPKSTKQLSHQEMLTIASKPLKE